MYFFKKKYTQKYRRSKHNETIVGEAKLFYAIKKSKLQSAGCWGATRLKFSCVEKFNKKSSVNLSNDSNSV